jgi:lysophospholipase L1-like esterase
MGMEYIDSLIFVGESTTYHMKDRGVLSDGRNTKQIWSPKSGTINLDLTTADLKIIYPPTNELMTIAEAATRSHPQIIVFTFGLNGAVQNIMRGEEYYKKCYKKLILSVKESAPKTKIILQSAPPITKDMDMSNYSVSSETLNEYIDKINLWSLELCEELDLRYLNSAESLKDSEGFLQGDLDTGDGHHLKAEAYTKLLGYIRTHAYK